MAGKELKGHVKSVATVATAEWYAPEVKAFPTVVTIDDNVKGLRPNMSASVTIHIKDTVKDALLLPIKAVVGGPEMGEKRKCFVMEDGTPVEREVVLGQGNSQYVQVISGLTAGDRVVVNPKELVGDSVKTRDQEPDAGKGKSPESKSRKKRKG